MTDAVTDAVGNPVDPTLGPAVGDPAGPAVGPAVGPAATAPAAGTRDVIPAAPTYTMPAGKVLAVMVLALTLAALFNSKRFVHTAEGLPFGWQRTALLAVARPVDQVAETLRFDRPRARLDQALGRSTGTGSGSGFADPLPSPAVTPQSAASPVPSSSAGPDGGPVSGDSFRDASRAEPLRLFVTGDSMIEFMAPKLFALADPTGALDGSREVKYGTGLVRDDFFDWPAHARAQMDSRAPEAVVVMMGGNDGQNFALPGGTVLQAPSAEWTAEYQRRATVMMRLFTGDGARHVYWVGMPPPKSARLFRIYTDVNTALAAAARSVPGVTYVDIWGDFAPDGRYTDFLPVDGRNVLVRARDGIHLNREGADLLARKLYSLIEGDWKLAD